MLMDGLPGVIHSADDFVMNSAGIVITETTIGHFSDTTPAGDSGICAGAQGGAVFGFHRRFCPHHERGQ
jgi:hypothetical protein